MSLASLTANGEGQGWQQLLIQKVHYLQNYDHGGDGGHGDDEVEDDDDNTLLALPRHDLPYSKGFMKFGCQEPSKKCLTFETFVRQRGV